MNGSIYMITELCTGKVYIGQTKNIPHRKAQYRHYTKAGDITKPKQRKFVEILIGKDFDTDFKFDILETGIDNQDLLNSREIFWINKYKATDPKYGYNVYEGGACSGKIADPIRKIWKLSSKKKRGVITYDTNTGSLAFCFSCASAASCYNVNSVGNLATSARTLRRICNKRYFIYFAEPDYMIKYIDKVIQKRFKTIKSIYEDDISQQRFKINVIINYNIKALTHYLDVLDFADELEISYSKNIRNKILHYIELLRSYKLPENH